MDSINICRKRVKYIFKKHLVIYFKLFDYTYDEIELEKLKKELYNNILNNKDILDTDKYIKKFREIGERVDCINIEGFIKDLKEFFESKEFKDLQELEKKTWHYKIEELCKILDNLNQLEFKKNFIFLIDTLKVFLKNTLFLNDKINYNSHNGYNICLSIKDILKYIKNDEKEGGNLKDLKEILENLYYKIFNLKTKTYMKDLY